MTGSSVWIGTEESFLKVLQARKFGLDHPERAEDIVNMYSDPYDDSNDDEEENQGPKFESHLIQVEGSVGILNINGPMVAEDAWYNRYFGLISYAEISRALVELVEDSSITDIVPHMDTGGGDVAGLEGATDTLKWAMSHKNVQAHATGSVFSAGYWFAAPAKKITLTKMSEAGSIGVLITLRSMYDYLEKTGITYKVIRAGKYKALSHPAEKISDAAIAEAESKAEQLYSFFLEHITTYRSALSLATKDSWAEGKTFFGQEAVTLGLADGISTLSQVIEDLSDDEEPANNDSNTLFSTEVATMAKSKDNQAVILKTAKAKAAFAEGATIEAAEALDKTALAAGEEEEAPPVIDPKGTGEPDQEAQASEDQDDSVATFLQTENTKLNAQVAELTSKLKTSESAVAEASADQKQLVDIALQNIQRMQIALGATPIDLEGLPASTVVAQHAKVRKTFEEKILTGQQSASAVDSQEEEDAADMGLTHGIVPKS